MKLTGGSKRNEKIYLAYSDRKTTDADKQQGTSGTEEDERY